MNQTHTGHAVAAFSLLLCALLAFTGASAGTLEKVREHGKLRCGVNGEVAGLSLQQADGAWSGLDVDICRAVAAATLGDANKVEFIPLSNQQRLSALAQNQIDVLARNTTWTLQRDTAYDMNFVGVSYYDGQGLMLPKAKGVFSVLELDGVSVCVQANSTSPENIKRFFTRHRMKLKLIPFASAEQQREGYQSGQCDAISSDQSQLYALRAQMAQADAQRILPEILSREPLGPAVRKTDAQWQDIVRWSLFALIDAEEKGIDSGNVQRVRQQAKSQDIRRFLGVKDNSAAAMGLNADWAFNIISQVGNYREIFERNLRPLGIKRGLNALWRDGGLMYAPPIR
jgi:general L-amino acid transport system substrate-binding protein